MTHVYLNLTKKQYAELGEAATGGKPLVLALSKSQFVQENKITKNTVRIKLTKTQVDKLNPSNMMISLTPIQCKRTVEDINKTYGGALPLLALAPLIMKGVAALGAIGAAAGGASQIANAVNNKKHQNQLIEETKRHNLEMEKTTGKGLFLAPHQKGQGLYLKPSP